GPIGHARMEQHFAHQYEQGNRRQREAADRLYGVAHELAQAGFAAHEEPRAQDVDAQKGEGHRHTHQHQDKQHAEQTAQGPIPFHHDAAFAHSVAHASRRMNSTDSRMKLTTMGMASHQSGNTSTLKIMPPCWALSSMLVTLSSASTRLTARHTTLPMRSATRSAAPFRPRTRMSTRM